MSESSPNEKQPKNKAAPLMIGAPFGYEYSFFDTIHRRNVISQHVVYQTVDNKLHLLRWDPSVGFGHAQLGAGWNSVPLPGVPAPYSLPTAYAFSVQGQAIQGQTSQRVLYHAFARSPKV